nr:tyrosine-protein phosphatase non-receptor type 9-like isoform X1 [Rhipicephalus microplus]
MKHNMAASLSTQEEQLVKEFMKVVNEQRLSHSAGPLTWNAAVKFMMARKFDVRRALSLYEAHEMTRYREGLCTFDPTTDPLKGELETGKFTVLPTRDSSGAAITMFTASKHWPLQSSHKVTLQGVVYQLDVALESLESQRCGIVFIYNMTGSKYQNFDYELSQKILNLLKGAYPARLKKVLIVNAPLWFKAPFRILRLFVREKLRDRVTTVSLEQLGAHIPYTSLPRELGGSLAINHKAWLLHCLKSMANRYNLSGEVPVPPAVLPVNPAEPVENDVVAGEVTEEEEEEEASSAAQPAAIETQNSVQEKQNCEEREKEVEVIKEPVTTTAAKEEPAEQTRVAAASPELVTEEEEDEKCPSSSSVSSSSQWDEGTANGEHKDGAVTLEEFISQLQVKGRRGLYQQYSELKAKSPEGTFVTARVKPNQCKNRYTDVLCFDHSRVILSMRNEDDCSTYINANFVDGYRQKNAFISTQGPLPKTYTDFWRMIWEQHCAVIVMTTRTFERGRGKCGQYWPPGEPGASIELEDLFKITVLAKDPKPDYVETQLELYNCESQESRSVSHLQFTSWPDYGVPDSALAMLAFRGVVREKQAQAVASMEPKWDGHPLGPPIVVHCSAGIGRTGTFITLDICIKQLEEEGRVDVRSTVERIRSQRAFSIQMPDQYVFCHLALLEFALLRGLLQDVALDGFDDDDDRDGSDSE